jgi:two-component system cell cycle sensor histidine kinase/response regulator CckA
MKKEILVVDNHPVMLRFMTNLLEREGHRVLTAPDGISALDVLRTYTPDIIFLDLIMPNISGDKLCRIIRSQQHLEKVHVIVLSAIAAEANFGEFGADACIAKGPFNKMGPQIFETLRQVERKMLADGQEKTAGIDDLLEREATKDLLSSKSHLEVILENMSEGLLELTSEGKVVYANATVISLVSVPEEKLLGSDFLVHFGPVDRDRLLPLLGATINGPRAITEEAPAELKGKPVSLNIIPVKEKGRSSFIVMINDVSEKRHIQNQLQHAQKMEAIATLAGGIAHEFNNALFAISGNIELLQMHLPQERDLDKYVEPIKPSIRKMSSLTGQLLAYAQEGKYRPQKLSLNAFVKETLPLIRHAVDASIRVCTDLSHQDLDIEADPTQMQMVLSALVANAEEAIERSGRIRITTKEMWVDEPFKREHPALKQGPHAWLTIEDNGKGMDEVTLRRIFEPFFTTKFQGRGLGMAAVYGIIKNHDGWISVESEPTLGTAVHIYLPVRKAEKPHERPKPRLTKGTGTVMVIEDEEPVMHVSRAILEHLGYEILEAKNGKEAVQLAKNYDGEIALALLDIGLPDMAGNVVYPLIKKARPNMKVAVCSGYDIEGPVQEILNAGAHGFLQKPYSLATFSAKLKEVLEI